jgi:hypothetical protein
LLWLRVCTARTWCCHDTSTDLTPELHVYIPPHLLHRSSHDIVRQCSYLVSYLVSSSARTMTVCRVNTYAPGRASFPKLRFKAPFQSSVSKLRFQSYPTPGGILTLILRQCRPSKSLHVTSNLFKHPSRSLRLYLPEFPRPAAGRHPAGYGFSSQYHSLDRPSTTVSTTAPTTASTHHSITAVSVLQP